ncbi:hypothetical protein ES705_33509 [subsurface metagenome]
MKKKAKFIEDEPSPVSYSTLNITIHDIHNYRILFGILRAYWLENSTIINFSPVTKLILNNLPLLSFVPAFYQAWTLCRYGEIKQIKIQSIKRSRDIIIKSSKSEHVRSVPAVPFSAEANLKLIKDKTKIQVVSYDSYKDSIARFIDNSPYMVFSNILNRTHIFRHLEATKQFLDGVPIPDISNTLGHVSDSATSEYIHKNWRF